MQVDAVEDAKAIRNYSNEVHEVVTELYDRQDVSPARVVRRSQGWTTLRADARKGDIKIEIIKAMKDMGAMKMAPTGLQFE